MFYSFWGKYQNHSSTLSLAPSMYISNGNSSLPVVICSHGSFSAERKRFAILSFGCSHFCPVFFDGKPLLGVMLSVVECIWTNCTLQGFLLYYKSPLRNILQFSSMNLRETTKSMILSGFPPVLISSLRTLFFGIFFCSRSIRLLVLFYRCVGLPMPVGMISSIIRFDYWHHCG